MPSLTLDIRLSPSQKTRAKLRLKFAVETMLIKIFQDQARGCSRLLTGDLRQYFAPGFTDGKCQEAFFSRLAADLETRTERRSEGPIILVASPEEPSDLADLVPESPPYYHGQLICADWWRSVLFLPNAPFYILGPTHQLRLK